MAGTMALPLVVMDRHMEVRAPDTDICMCWRILPLPALRSACFRDSTLVAVTSYRLFIRAGHVHNSATLKLGCGQQAWAGMAAHMGPGAMVVAACTAGQWEEA